MKKNEVNVENEKFSCSYVAIVTREFLFYLLISIFMTINKILFTWDGEK
ncbi:putative integral membrane protein [Arcanobacterium hippocoleae]|uniref:Integral membrane protein n=1 Tax=Arcanobacterium hippocoleae TaxID=149017 RepID=A0ABU1T1J9_9ACTO|nr:putative integral membrane protein [Arcanobacterium hippocoleae]